jgi:hypothetical protein
MSQKERDALKLCPFCGSSGIIRHDMTTGDYGACCVKCYGEVRCIYKEVDDARIAWNRRYPDEKPERDALGHTKECQYLDWHGICTCGKKPGKIERLKVIRITETNDIAADLADKINELIDRVNGRD